MARLAVLIVIASFLVAVQCALPTKIPTKGPTSVPAPTPKPRVCTEKCMAKNGAGKAPIKCKQVWPKPAKGWVSCKEGNGTIVYPDVCGFYQNAAGSFPDDHNCYPIVTKKGNSYPNWCNGDLGYYPNVDGSYPACPKH